MVANSRTWNSTPKLEALQRWAERCYQKLPPPDGEERRNAEREQITFQLNLIPLDEYSLKPMIDDRTVVVTKDRSVNGLGVITIEPLRYINYLAEFPDTGELLLLRRVRRRAIHGAVVEIGFTIVDRVDNSRFMA